MLIKIKDSFKVYINNNLRLAIEHQESSLASTAIISIREDVARASVIQDANFAKISLSRVFVISSGVQYMFANNVE